MEEKKKRGRKSITIVKFNLYILGVLYFLYLYGIFSGKVQDSAILTFILGLVAIVAAFLLSKNKKIGVQLAWFYVTVAMMWSVYDREIINILIFGNLAYWIYRMQKDKNNELK
jgi:uncharacterized membrane protein (UPF0136 family)